MSCGNNSPCEGKSRKIIIPKGSIHPNETVVIEIPSRLRNNSTVLARRRSTPCPGSYATPPLEMPPITAATPSPSVPRAGTPPHFLSTPRAQQQNPYAPMNQTMPTLPSFPARNLTFEESIRSGYGGPSGIYGTTQFNNIKPKTLQEECYISRGNRNCYDELPYLPITRFSPGEPLNFLNNLSVMSCFNLPQPPVDSDISIEPLNDTCYHDLPYSSKKGSNNNSSHDHLSAHQRWNDSLSNIYFLSSPCLGPTPFMSNPPQTNDSISSRINNDPILTSTRETCNVNAYDTTFYSLGGTPRRGPVLVDDTILHSLDKLPNRDIIFDCTPLYALDDPPRKGSALLGLHYVGGIDNRDTSLFDKTRVGSLDGSPRKGSSLLGGTAPNRDTILFDGTTFYSLDGTPRRGSSLLLGDTALYSLDGTPRRGSSLLGDTTLHSLGETPNRDTFYFDTTFYSLDGTPRRGSSLLGDTTLHSLRGTPNRDTLIFDGTTFYSLDGTPRRGSSLLLGDTALYSLDGTPRRGSSLLGDTTLHSLGGTPNRDTFYCDDTFYSLDGTPRRGSSLLGDTALYSLDGTPRRGSSLLGDTTLHSLGGTPNRDTFLFDGTRFYSLDGTPRRGSSLLGDTALYSLGGTPNRDTLIFDGTTFYSLDGTPRRGSSLLGDTALYSLDCTPRRGSSLLGDTTLHSLGGTPNRDTLFDGTTFYSLDGTPRRGSSLLGDTALYSLDGTPRRGSSLLGDTTLHSLGGTPNRDTILFDDTTFYSLDGTPRRGSSLLGDTALYSLDGTLRRGSSLLGDTTLHSLGGTPNRDTFYCDDTFYSLDGTPRRGSSLLGDTTLHSLGGTPNRDTFLFDGTRFYSLDGTPRRGSSLLGDTALYSLDGTPRRGSPLLGDTTLHSLNGTPNRDTFYCEDTTFYSLDGTPRTGSPLLGDTTLHSLGGTPNRDTLLFDGTTFYSLDGTPRRGSSLLGDTALYSLDGTPRRGSSLLGDTTLHSLGGTPNRDTFYCDDTFYSLDGTPRRGSSLLGDTALYSLDGTPRRGSSLLGDTTLHSLGGTPNRDTFYCDDTFYSLDGTPRRGSSLLGDTTLHSLGGTPNRVTFYVDDTAFYSLDGTPRRGSSLLGDTTLHSLSGTPRRGSSLFDDTTMHSLGGTPERGGEPANVSQSLNATYRAASPTIRRRDKPDVSFEPPFVSTPKGECDPCTKRNISAPINPVTTAQPFRGNRSYAGGPIKNVRPLNTYEHHVSLGPQISRIDRTTTPRSFSSLETVSGEFDPDPVDDEDCGSERCGSSSGEMNTTLLGRVIGGDIPRILIWPTPASQRTPKQILKPGDIKRNIGAVRKNLFNVGIGEVNPSCNLDLSYNRGNLTYNAEDSYGADLTYNPFNPDQTYNAGNDNQGNVTYNADNGNRGNATYNADNGNRGNATFNADNGNRGNVTYNACNGNRANLTYNADNQANVTYNRGNTPGAIDANATYACSLPSNQSPFVRRNDNLGRVGSPCAQRNLSAPIPPVATPPSLSGNLNNSYAGHPTDFVPSIPVQYMNPIPKYTLANGIPDTSSVETFTEEVTEEYESSWPVDDSGVFCNLTNVDIPNILGWPNVCSPRTPNPNATYLQPNLSGAKQNLPSFNRTFPVNQSSASNKTYDDVFPESQGRECPDETCASSETSGNLTYSAGSSPYPSGLNQTYSKNVTFGANGTSCLEQPNLTYNMSQNATDSSNASSQRGNCGCNKNESSFSPIANSTTIGEGFGNRTYKKTSKRRTKAILTPEGSECGCAPTNGETGREAETVGLQRMEAAENTMLHENLRNWQEARRRLILDTTMLTTSSTSTDTKDGECGCR